MDVNAIHQAEQRAKSLPAIEINPRHLISSNRNHELKLDSFTVKSNQESEKLRNDRSSSSLSDFQQFLKKEIHGENTSRRIRFSMDEDTGRMAIRVIDGKTEEILQEIPPEEVLQIMEKLRRYNGSFFDDRA